MGPLIVPVQRNVVDAGKLNTASRLPFELRLEDFRRAMQDVYDFFFDVNTGLVAKGLDRLDDTLRPAIMSGVLSDMLAASLAKHSRVLTVNNYFNGHPDLVVLGRDPNNPSHEAVIVSDGGQNARAALAFLMLERLGQRKVSMLMDSMDDWGLGSMPLAKEATKVSPRQSRFDLSIPPVAYRASARPGVVTKDLASTKSHSPKVFIASGQQMPREVARRHRDPGAVCEPAERRRHAQAGEGLVDDARQGRRAALRGDRHLPRRSRRSGRQPLHPEADGISGREGTAEVARRTGA